MAVRAIMRLSFGDERKGIQGEGWNTVVEEIDGPLQMLTSKRQ